jgi:hypothetical protein
MVPIETQHLQFGTVCFVADAGNYREPPMRYDRHSVWSRSGREDCSGFKGFAIEPYQACRPTVGHKYLTLVSNYAGRFWKIVQCTHVPVRVMVDHFNAIAAGVRNEHTTRLRVESSMVEKSTTRAGYFDNADRCKRHGGGVLLLCLFFSTCFHADVVVSLARVLRVGL